jgi:glycosyltransferase involved in cell wall biosynthesis
VSGERLVTVAVPTRNRADLLSQTLASVLAQDHGELEILVSDNASADGTRDLVGGLADARIRYLRHETDVGMAANWNACVKAAHGSWFLLLSDDDLIDADFVSSCLAALSSQPEAGIVRTGTRLIDEAGRLLAEAPNRGAGLSDAELFRAWFAGRTSFFLCSTLFATRPLKDLGGFHSPRGLALDLRTALLLGSRHGRADVEAVKASYRYQEASVSNAAHVDDWLDDSFDLLDLMCELSPDDATVLREEGLAYFARRNQDRAAAIRSLPARWAALSRTRRRCRQSGWPPLGALVGTAGPVARRLRALRRSLRGDAG